MAGPTVYFARVGRDGPIKIGFTGGDPLDRIADLQTGCPWPIALIGAVPGTTQDEACLHMLFPELRLEGEWFRPEDRLMMAIAEILAGRFRWPSRETGRVLPAEPTISDIIWAAGGPNKIATASRGGVAIDAIHKWRRNGIRDWHWALLMSLCDVSVEQLYAANQMALPAPAALRAV